MFLNYLGHRCYYVAWLASLTCHNHREVMEHDRTYLSKLKVFASQLRLASSKKTVCSHMPLWNYVLCYIPNPNIPNTVQKPFTNFDRPTHCMSVMVNLAAQPSFTLHESRFNFSFCELSGLHENIDHDKNC